MRSWGSLNVVWKANEPLSLNTPIFKLITSLARESVSLFFSLKAQKNDFFKTQWPLENLKPKLMQACNQLEGIFGSSYE